MVKVDPAAWVDEANVDLAAWVADLVRTRIKVDPVEWVDKANVDLAAWADVDKEDLAVWAVVPAKMTTRVDLECPAVVDKVDPLVVVQVTTMVKEALTLALVAEMVVKVVSVWVFSPSAMVDQMVKKARMARTEAVAQPVPVIKEALDSPSSVKQLI